MSERKTQTRYIPLRVRFRPMSEYYEREQNAAPSDLIRSTQPLVPDLSHASEIERRTQQIKELLRLSHLLRADLGLPEVLQQIASSIVACTGFRRLAINLIDEEKQQLTPLAFAGLTEEEKQTLRESNIPIETLFRLMRPEFQISQSYFIPHQHVDVYDGKTCIEGKSPNLDVDERERWHPDDSLVLPLYSPRAQKLLGFLSIDEPVDGKIPTVESIEITELFANQAAIAIDNALLFQEQEDERIALDEAITLLREDLELLRQSDFRRPIRSGHKKLQSVADAINSVVAEISGILHNMQNVTNIVDVHTSKVQKTAERLVADTASHERQVQQLSHVVNEIASTMSTISESAARLSKAAVEVVEVTVEALGSVDRAVEGMGLVREATKKSARTMKSLSESGQEINETVLALTDLTMRMHLLALNAAIEATRAGTQGEGFAVIAQEIRTLAVNSAQSARKVEAYIRTIQQEATSVSQSIEQSTQQVILQTELVTQTGVAIEAISIVTEQLSTFVEDICKAAETQSQNSQHVASRAREIFDRKNDITGNVQEVQQSVKHLAQLTDNLRSRISAIRLREH